MKPRMGFWHLLAHTLYLGPAHSPACIMQSRTYATAPEPSGETDKHKSYAQNGLAAR